MGISIWQLLIILAIVLVLFGAKRLRSLGSDLGSAVKGFKQSMREEETKPDPEQLEERATPAEGRVIDGEVSPQESKKA